MTDWKSAARARQLDIPEESLDAVAATLEGLERVFRPLTAAIPLEVEPAVTFRAGEEDE